MFSAARTTSIALLIVLLVGASTGCNDDPDNNGDNGDTGTADTTTSDTVDDTADNGDAISDAGDTMSDADATEDSDTTDDADADSCPEPEVIDSNITEDTTWSATPDCVDYRVVSAIDIEATLTVEPGTEVVVEEDNFLEVVESGTISAVGTDAAPITFSGTEESAGFWRGIWVESDQSENALDYVEIRDAGSEDWLGESNSQGALFVFGGDVTITNTTFRNNANYALQVRGDDSSITGFDKNTFEGNDVPMWLKVDRVGELAGTSTFNGNDDPAIHVTLPTTLAGVVTTDATWKSFDIPYRLMYATTLEANVTLEAGTTVEVTQGVLIEVSGAGSGGSLTSDGTSESPVIITGAEEIPGHWRGIDFLSSSTANQLAYAEVRYAGDRSWGDSDERNGAIVLGDSGTVSLDNATIGDAFLTGVYISTGQIVSCEDVTFENIPGENVVDGSVGGADTCGL